MVFQGAANVRFLQNIANEDGITLIEPYLVMDVLEWCGAHTSEMVDLEEKVFFIKSAKTGLDIDFYLPGEQTLIQVSYSLEDSSREREVKALSKAGKLMPEVRRFIIITFNESGKINAGNTGIEVIPAWKWLLER